MACTKRDGAVLLKTKYCNVLYCTRVELEPEIPKEDDTCAKDTDMNIYPRMLSAYLAA